jgi:hypothetical protein
MHRMQSLSSSLRSSGGIRPLVGLAFVLPVAIVLGATLMSAPARAQQAPPAAAEPEDLVLLSGRAEVPRGQVAGQVIVFRGTAVIEGVAQGDVVVVSGRAQVSGQVSGSVVVIDGTAVLGSSAQVRGGVLSGGSARVREGARVEGEVRENVPFSLEWLGALGGLAAWMAVGISALLLGLLLLWIAPRGADAVALAAREAPWASAGWGVFWALAIPVLAIVAMMSLFALPLGLGLLLGLWLLFSTGYTWTGWAMGRALLGPDRGRAISLLAGVGILQVLGAIPFVGGIVWLLAGAFGLGASTVAVWRARGVGGKHRPGRAAPTTWGAEPVDDRREPTPVESAEAPSSPA